MFSVFETGFLLNLVYGTYTDEFIGVVLVETIPAELFCRMVVRSFVVYLDSYETQKGSSRVSRGRTILSSVKLLFFLECRMLLICPKQVHTVQPF